MDVALFVVACDQRDFVGGGKVFGVACYINFFHRDLFCYCSNFVLPVAIAVRHPAFLAIVSSSFMRWALIKGVPANCQRPPSRSYLPSQRLLNAHSSQRSALLPTILAMACMLSSLSVAPGMTGVLTQRVNPSDRFLSKRY